MCQNVFDKAPLFSSFPKNLEEKIPFETLKTVQEMSVVQIPFFSLSEDVMWIVAGMGVEALALLYHRYSKKISEKDFLPKIPSLISEEVQKLYIQKKTTFEVDESLERQKLVKALPDLYVKAVYEQHLFDFPAYTQLIPQEAQFLDYFKEIMERILVLPSKLKIIEPLLKKPWKSIS